MEVEKILPRELTSSNGMYVVESEMRCRSRKESEQRQKVLQLSEWTSERTNEKAITHYNNANANENDDIGETCMWYDVTEVGRHSEWLDDEHKTLTQHSKT